MNQLSAAPLPDTAEDPSRAPTADYEGYFRSGAYDARYPAANPRVLAHLKAHLPPGGHVIDYGCGSGRYLFALRADAGRAAGFDICAAARELLQQRAAVAGWCDLAVLGPDPASLAGHVAQAGRADLVLCLFGVLAHLPAARDRIALLRRLRATLVPSHGRLVISVPNRRRRFLLEQVQAGRRAQGAIRYRRHLRGETIRLPYQLFDARRLCAELEAAGFRVETLLAESLFSETAVLNSALTRALDRLLAPQVPASLGYGLLAVAAPLGPDPA